jgi:hypothetical protein
MSDFPTPIHEPGPVGAAAAQAPVALRSALVGAIGRRRRRVRYRAAITGCVCAAVAAALLGGGVFAGGPGRVLAIDDGSEWVRVQILDGDAGAAEMTAELQDAGIDGEVRRVPAVPHLVGHWMGIGLHERCPGEVRCVTLGAGMRVGGIAVGLDRNTFVIRRDYASEFFAGKHLIFYVGREPEAGETPLGAPPRTDDLVVGRLGDLQDFHRPRIAKFANRKGIPGVSKMNKWEILEALRRDARSR